MYLELIYNLHSGEVKFHRDFS